MEFGKWVCGFARIFILGVGNLRYLEVTIEQIKFSYSLKVVVFLVESWVFLGRSVGFLFRGGEFVVIEIDGC